MNSELSLKFLTSPKSRQYFHKSSISENRYNFLTEEPSQLQPTQEFSIKEILPQQLKTHNRVISQPIHFLTPEVLFGHKRQKSLGQRPLGKLYDTFHTSTPKIEKTGKKYKKKENIDNHSRKLSDCDIVLFGEQEIMTSQETIRKSLPVFGCNPCSAYCKYCNKEVNTRIEFQKKNPIAFNLLDFVSSFFACCGEPT